VQVAYPEQAGFDFSGPGPDAAALRAGLATVRAALGAHACAAAAGCALVAARAARGGPPPRGALAALAAAHVGVSGCCLAALPGLWAWLAVFPVEAACLHGWAAALAPGAARALAGGGALFAAAALRAAHPGVRLAVLVKTGVVAAGAARLAEAAEAAERARWARLRAYRAELAALRARLGDLLPPRAARAAAAAGRGRAACEAGAAAVLQLDVCGFTALARAADPREVARLLHRVFCAFDRAVAARPGLRKVPSRRAGPGRVGVGEGGRAGPVQPNYYWDPAGPGRL
jgi:hypothetical protein